MVGQFIIGITTAYTGNRQINFFFFDLFKGILAIFILEMGVVASQRFNDLKKVGLFLMGFGLVIRFISANLGIAVAMLISFLVDVAIILATMGASASYIAAPVAMKIALPKANANFI